MIFALCRYGGLRCPSEVLKLTWGDISWEQSRMLVHAPKTEHHADKATRLVPLFPELREVLEEGFRAARHEQEEVTISSFPLITRYQHSSNLRTQFERLIKRAGTEALAKAVSEPPINASDGVRKCRHPEPRGLRVDR